MALVETVKSGDIRASLEAVRDHLANELENGARCVKCGGSVSSPTTPLSKLLADIVVTIDGLPVQEGSAVDDLAARRRDRKAGTSVESAKPRQRRAGGDAAGGKRGAES